jgi:hypothetical protein
MSYVNIYVWNKLMFPTPLNASLLLLLLCVFCFVVSYVVMSVLYVWFCFIYGGWGLCAAILCLIYVMIQTSVYIYISIYVSFKWIF